MMKSRKPWLLKGEKTLFSLCHWNACFSWSCIVLIIIITADNFRAHNRRRFLSASWNSSSSVRYLQFQSFFVMKQETASLSFLFDSEKCLKRESIFPLRWPEIHAYRFHCLFLSRSKKSHFHNKKTRTHKFSVSPSKFFFARVKWNIGEKHGKIIPIE